MSLLMWRNLRIRPTVSTMAGLNQLNCHNHVNTNSKEGNVEALANNPYFKKYAKKITASQRDSHPVHSLRPEAIKLKAQGSIPIPTAEARPFSRATAPKPAHGESSRNKKTLDSVMKVELTRDKTADEISQIWRRYHLDRDAISAVIPADVYAEISKRSKLFPMFLYPLPRSQGYEFFVAEFKQCECHFTSLINYQAYKENAPECLNVVHYPDLREEKGIVLMQGEFNKDLLNVSEAQCLANQLQLFYTAPENESKYQMLKTFNQDPDNFKYMDVIAEIQNSSI